MKKLNTLDWIAITTLFIGGLNWGLVGAFNFDLVAILFGKMSLLSRLIYGFVGISALYVFFEAFAWNRSAEPTIEEAMRTHKLAR